MGPGDAKSWLELARENPFETFLLVVAALVLVALFAGAKKVGEKIAMGANAIRGVLLSLVILAVIVIMFILGNGCPKFCDPDTMSLEEYRECRKCKDLPE